MLSFEKSLPNPEEILYYANDIDVNKSSAVEGINTKYCVDVIKCIPDILCCIYIVLQ